MRVTHLPLLSQIFTPQKCVRWIVFLGCNDVFRCLLLGTGSRATIIIMYWLGLYMRHCFQCKTCHCNVSWNLSIYIYNILYMYIYILLFTLLSSTCSVFSWEYALRSLSISICTGWCWEWDEGADGNIFRSIYSWTRSHDPETQIYGDCKSSIDLFLRNGVHICVQQAHS